MHTIRTLGVIAAAVTLALTGIASGQMPGWTMFAGPIEYGNALRCVARHPLGVQLERYAVSVPGTQQTYIESIISLPVPEAAVEQFAIETETDNPDRLNVEATPISAGLGLDTGIHMPTAINIAGQGYRVGWFFSEPDPLREADEGMTMMSAKVNQVFLEALASQGALEISLLDASGQPALRSVTPLGDFTAINNELNTCAVRVDFSDPIESPNA